MLCGIFANGECEAASKDIGKVQELGMKFKEFLPHFERPLTPEESVTAVMKVVEEKSVKNGDGGSFINHLGNKNWL